MKFCSNCGQNVHQDIPQGDNRLRYVCASCSSIHYENPRIIAGCIPIFNDQVLLCKRAIEPRYGYWTLPAGFMENGESTEHAAKRETLEETRAHVNIIKLYTLTSILHVNQVQMIYLAELPEPNFGISNESLEVELFHEQDIPWEELAFPTIFNALEFFFEDRKQGQFPFRHLSLYRNADNQLKSDILLQQ